MRAVVLEAICEGGVEGTFTCRVNSVKAGAILLGTIFGSTFLNLYFGAVYCEPTYVKLAFKQQVLKENPPCYVNRSNLTQYLANHVMVMKKSGVFHLVNGPLGCGKSTALKEAVSMQPGAMYFEVLPDGSFPMSLSKALSIDFACQSGSFYDYTTATFRRKCTTDRKEHLIITLEILKFVVKDMEQPPTLVIDNVSALLHDALGKELITVLQEFAKSMADDRLMSIVLAGSEGRLLNFLYKRPSSASRLAVSEIPTDIPLDEASTYLRCMCPQITTDEVNIVISLVGGRFVHLSLAASGIEAGHNTERAKQKLFGIVQYELKQLKISLPPSSVSSELANTTWSLAKALLDSPERKVTYEEFFFLLEQQVEDEREKDSLIQSNIFLISFGKDVTFQSTLVQTYFETQLRKN